MRVRNEGMLGLWIAIAAFSFGCSASKDEHALEDPGSLDTGTKEDAIIPSDTGTALPDTAGEDTSGFTPDSDLDAAPPPPLDGCRIAVIGEPGVHPSDVFDKWLEKSGAKGATVLKEQTLTSKLLTPYKMIVARNVSGWHTFTSAEVTALRNWVSDGGGLLTLTGFGGTDESKNVNLLLAPFGIDYGSTLVLYGGGTTVPVTKWTTHPVTKGITRIGFDNGYEALGTATTIGSESGYNVFKAKTYGTGHVLAWGDEWIMFDTEWSAHPDYQVKLLWQNIVDWFNPGAGCVVPDPPK